MPLIKNVNQMNERISFQKKIMRRNESGQIVEELTTIGQCWCKVQKQLLKEYQSSIGTVLQDTVNFVIRSIQDFEINHTMKIEYKNKSYEIIQSLPDATDEEYMIYIAKLTS